jgi:hypothetical protein
VPQMNATRLTVLGACLLSGLVAGCSSQIDPDSAIASVNRTNIERLANLYSAYQSQHDWHGPTDEADFKAFVRRCDAHLLTRIGIDPNVIDKLFVSERDGQPFKIRYGVPGSAMGSSAPVIFESAGSGGKRLVGFLNMQQRQVDDAEYNTLWSSKSDVRPQRDIDVGQSGRHS